MSKLTDITIVNNHTLRLNTDAFKNDEIDLQLINDVDLTIINQKIMDQKDAEYNRRLDSLRREWDLTKEKEIQLAIESAKEKNIKLERDLELAKENITTSIKSQFDIERLSLSNKITSLKKELESLTKDKANEIDLALQRKENDIKDVINELKNKINNLQNEKKEALREKEFEYQTRVLTLESENVQLKTNFKLEKEKALHNLENEFEEKFRIQEEIINKLKLDKSSLNVKKMGEELEKWVDQEYQNYALNGFESSMWYKDNLVVNNTKADFIYKVFANEERKNEELLTSIAVEVKSENPETVSKKKNSDHYKKLNEDRINKNCEYALLISELEWDVVNDAPIRRVNEYEKMYLVRPQYFMVFIHILTALSLKYKNVLIEHNLELDKFRDVNEIVNEFNEMKSSILDGSIKYINDHVKKIEENAVEIIKRGNKILESSKIIKDTHLITVINKIENFKINRIVKNIKDIDF
ncbi:MAG: DUF2130 domain-containing protein [Candidatus Izemoplasmatales bacterium]